MRTGAGFYAPGMHPVNSLRQRLNLLFRFEIMNLDEFTGKRVKVWILGQAQENLTPGITFEGILRGIDQSVYIIENRQDEDSTGKYTLIPAGQCKISVLE
jgi:hypothetical protein